MKPWRPKDYKNPWKEFEWGDGAVYQWAEPKLYEQYEQGYNDCLEAISKLSDQEIIDFWRIIKEV